MSMDRVWIRSHYVPLSLVDGWAGQISARSGRYHRGGAANKEALLVAILIQIGLDPSLSLFFFRSCNMRARDGPTLHPKPVSAGLFPSLLPIPSRRPGHLKRTCIVLELGYTSEFSHDDCLKRNNMPCSSLSCNKMVGQSQPRSHHSVWTSAAPLRHPHQARCPCICSPQASHVVPQQSIFHFSRTSASKENLPSDIALMHDLSFFNLKCPGTAVPASLSHAFVFFFFSNERRSDF